MAKLSNGNFYPQKIIMDYRNKKLRLNVDKEEFALRDFQIEEPQKIRKFPDFWHKIFLGAVIVLLSYFIYSDILLWIENPLANSFLILLWLGILILVLRYYLTPEYQANLINRNITLILKLNEREKTELLACYDRLSEE